MRIVRTAFFTCMVLLIVGCTTQTELELQQSSTSLAVLYSMSSDTGVAPRDGLTLGPDGMLWGSAWMRGPNRIDPPAGQCSSTGNWSSDYQTKLCPGDVFRVSTDGTTFEVVHAFTTLDDHYRNADGYQPTSAPVD